VKFQVLQLKNTIIRHGDDTSGQTKMPRQRTHVRGHGKGQGHPSSNHKKYKTTRSFGQGSLEDLTLLTQAQKRNLGKQL